MVKRLCLLCALCLALAACGRRVRNNQPTLPAPAMTTAATNAPGTAPEGATDSPGATDSAPGLVPREASDSLGDEIDRLLEQLDSANSGADSEMEQLAAP